MCFSKWIAIFVLLILTMTPVRAEGVHSAINPEMVNNLALIHMKPPRSDEALSPAQHFMQEFSRRQLYYSAPQECYRVPKLLTLFGEFELHVDDSLYAKPALVTDELPKVAITKSAQEIWNEYNLPRRQR